MSLSTQPAGELAEFGRHLINKAQWQNPPEAISWWPDTTMWTVMLCLVILAIFTWIIRLGFCWLKRTYIRQARLYFIEYDITNNLMGIAALMRQFSQQHWPTEQLSTLDTAQFSKRIVALTPKSKITEAAVTALLVQSYQSQPHLSSEHRLAIHNWFKEMTC